MWGTGGWRDVEVRSGRVSWEGCERGVSAGEG